MPDHHLRTLALRTLLAAFPGTTLPTWARRLLDEGLAGYVLFGRNIETRPQVHDLVSDIRATRPDAVVAIDEEGGDVTRLAHAEGSPYPGNAALGAVNEPDLTYRVYQSIGAELRQLGIGLNLAPVVDVNTSDENPIIGTRSFGVDPALVARHAVAAVQGLRSAGVAACAKHFPGHGATVADSHLELPTVDAPLEVLRQRELVPFVAVIEAGIPAVMSAHIRVPALTGDAPATLSPRALAGMLRSELGFTGVIITDALEMRGASASIGIPEAAVRALAAGADLLCIGAEVDAELVDAVAAAISTAIREGRLDEERVAAAAQRVTALASPSATASQPSDPGSLGLAAARRALRVEGTLPRLDRPVLVQIDTPATIAAGDLPWGIAPYLLAATDAHLIRIPPADTVDAIDLDGILAAAAGRPMLVVSRDSHRRPYARQLIERLCARHPQVVLVEMGWPTRWRPEGLTAYIATYGSSQANARAAADLLLNAFSPS